MRLKTFWFFLEISGSISTPREIDKLETGLYENDITSFCFCFGFLLRCLY